MEALKKAIERARHERKGAGDSAPVAARALRSHALNSDELIRYTKTVQIRTPIETLEEHRIFVNTGGAEISHAYKTLRTQVRQRLVSSGWNSLAVTSVADGEGKSVTAINLAIGLARDVNHTVLLVDLDLRRPSVHKYFDFEPERGLSDYLLGGGDVSGLFVNPGIDRLVLVPGKGTIENSSEALSSPRMVGLMDEFKHRYKERIIILDMPPLLSADDVVAFAPHVDACLLVVEVGKTRKEDIARAKSLLKRSKLIGTVLNKSRSHGRSGYY